MLYTSMYQRGYVDVYSMSVSHTGSKVMFPATVHVIVQMEAKSPCPTLLQEISKFPAQFPLQIPNTVNVAQLIKFQDAG